MPVIVPAFFLTLAASAASHRDIFLGDKSAGGDVRMAFQAVLIADRE
jgi:hypothetical protein